MITNEEKLRAIHAHACAAVIQIDRTLTPDVDAFWRLYLQAALHFDDAAANPPIGYLPANEVARLCSGHNANLRSAKFGPSQLDGDVAVYLAARICDGVLDDAALDVLAERHRQIAVEGFTPEQDDEHRSGALAFAAVAYALDAGETLDLFARTDPADRHEPLFWPFSSRWWKPGEPRRGLVKAAALILAEIERVDRATIAEAAEKGDNA